MQSVVQDFEERCMVNFEVFFKLLTCRNYYKMHIHPWLRADIPSQFFIFSTHSNSYSLLTEVISWASAALCSIFHWFLRWACDVMLFFRMPIVRPFHWTEDKRDYLQFCFFSACVALSCRPCPCVGMSANATSECVCVCVYIDDHLHMQLIVCSHIPPLPHNESSVCYTYRK